MKSLTVTALLAFVAGGLSYWVGMRPARPIQEPIR